MAARRSSLRSRPCGSLVRGALPRGCRQCERGAKMVLFVTGLCAYRCYYCPVSDEKMGKDVAYADEMRVAGDEDILAEARAIRAQGAGITGGDPLQAMDRLRRYLRLLKREFGPGFHTHLYTMTTDPERIRQAAEVGLDEIRFHVPPGLWGRVGTSDFVPAVRLARRLGMSVGFEVPLVPALEKDLIELVRWAESEGLDFVNLDELEFSPSNRRGMNARGHRLKDELSHGVEGADEVAGRLLAMPWRVTVHYCTSEYKDAWQLRQRLRRRARTVAKPRDQVTEDGTLLKGVIEAEDLAAVERELIATHRVPRRLVAVVPDRGRVEIAPWILDGIAARLPWPSFIVEEYPTADRLEVERQRLKGSGRVRSRPRPAVRQGNA